MHGLEFKERALHEGQRYGEDRMVFLREFAQNARDAGARKIGVTTSEESLEMTLVFGDDGAGMDFFHAEEFLFTLYASSKENDEASAGRFGVGFWSVLLFDPTSIEIESRIADGSGWKVVFDGDLGKPVRHECELANTGTRITLKRKVVSIDESERTRIEIERALKRYCRYLRRSDKRGSALPISFNGKHIEEPFVLDGPCWLTFRDGPLEGAVGLGTRPKVEVFARGLPVWRGTLLDELHYGASPVKPLRHPQGLAPVYLLNGNDLNVTLDRRTVVDDRALARLRRMARSRMRELLRRYLDEVSPRPFHERVLDRLGGFVEEIQLGGHVPVIMAVTALLLLFGATLLVGFHLFGNGETALGMGTDIEFAKGPISELTERPFSLANPTHFDGPMIVPRAQNDVLNLAYRPEVEINFRMAAYEALDAGRGIVGTVPKVAAGASQYRCKEDCVDVVVIVNAQPGLLVLPVPTGYMVEPHTISIDKKAIGSLLASDAGEPVLELEHTLKGVLKYRVGPVAEKLGPLIRKQLVRLPISARLGDELEEIVVLAGQTKAVAGRVELLRRFVEGRLRYDRSVEVSKNYRAFLASKPVNGWFEFVLGTESGDCDVKNTVLVAMIRRAGIPARLAIGVRGLKGRTIPGLHAWVEYYDRGWKSTDATGTGATGRVLPSGTPTTQPVPIGTDDRQPLVDNRQPLSAPPVGSTRNVDQRSVPRLPPLMIASGVVFILAAALWTLLFILGKRNDPLFAPGGSDARHQVAAEMVMNALVHPEAWLKSGGVAKRKLLPLLGGRKISLNRALVAARNGGLWKSRGGYRLVNRALKSGASVLDSADPAFGALVSRLPQVLDLDAVAELKPVSPSRVPTEIAHVGRLVKRMNQLLLMAGLPKGLIRPCLGHLDSSSRDVDLSSLKLGGRMNMPDKFVALSVRSKAVLERAELGRKSLNLAAFMTLDVLISKSDLLGHHGRRIRRVAASVVLEMEQ
jgi:transglutaminase superfamily protein/histidine kinase/DNA gyrase B/HSP90-like ATPase